MAFNLVDHDEPEDALEGLLCWMTREDARIQEYLACFQGEGRAHALRGIAYVWVEAWVAAQHYTLRHGDDGA